jgi:hypothetical protein
MKIEHSSTPSEAPTGVHRSDGVGSEADGEKLPVLFVP